MAHNNEYMEGSILISTTMKGEIKHNMATCMPRVLLFNSPSFEIHLEESFETKNKEINSRSDFRSITGVYDYTELGAVAEHGSTR